MACKYYQRPDEETSLHGGLNEVYPGRNFVSVPSGGDVCRVVGCRNRERERNRLDQDAVALRKRIDGARTFLQLVAGANHPHFQHTQNYQENDPFVARALSTGGVSDASIACFSFATASSPRSKIVT